MSAVAGRLCLQSFNLTLLPYHHYRHLYWTTRHHHFRYILGQNTVYDFVRSLLDEVFFLIYEFNFGPVLIIS